MSDPRLDPGVKTARRAEWIRDDQWDGDTLRPGFTERLAPYDPNPVDDITNQPHPPVRAADVTQHPLPPLHGYHRLFGWAIVGAAVGAVLALFGTLWVMSGGAW